MRLGPFLSNTRNPKWPALSENAIDRHKRLQWINSHLIGPPQGTEFFTSVQLEEMDMVGIYEHPEGAFIKFPLDTHFIITKKRSRNCRGQFQSLYHADHLVLLLGTTRDSPTREGAMWCCDHFDTVKDDPRYWASTALKTLPLNPSLLSYIEDLQKFAAKCFQHWIHLKTTNPADWKEKTLTYLKGIPTPPGIQPTQECLNALLKFKITRKLKNCDPQELQQFHLTLP